MRVFAVFISAVAAYWWTMGIWASHASPAWYGVPVIVAALTIVPAFRPGPTAASAGPRWRFGRAFFIATGFEAVAFLAAFLFVPAMQANDFSASVSAIIVGLHFLIFAWLLPARLYSATGAVLIGLGATGFAIGNADLHVQFVCLGGACTFWLTYGAVARARVVRARFASGACS